jgi:pimeloyl-ACP methyl ester carboxylesterase
VKSTNVRNIQARRTRVVRGAFGVLNHAFPRLAARWGERVFFTPPRSALTASVGDFLATGHRTTVTAEGRTIAAWSWGSGPAVYLVHGWGGRGGQLAAFGPALVRAGHRVVTFDAPGHGASPGRHSSLLDFARGLREVVSVFGPAHAVIAHSLGGAATAVALGRGLPIGRAVFIAPPADPAEWTRRLAHQLGMTPTVLRLMQERSEQRLGFQWSELDVPRLASRSSVPLLVIHDRDDPEVSHADGEAIVAASPEARLVTTQGLGHHRILRHHRVVEEAVSFVARAPGERDLPAADVDWDQLSLDRYLFDRDERWRPRAGS